MAKGMVATIVGVGDSYDKAYKRAYGDTKADTFHPKFHNVVIESGGTVDAQTFKFTVRSLEGDFKIEIDGTSTILDLKANIAKWLSLDDKGVSSCTDTLCHANLNGVGDRTIAEFFGPKLITDVGTT